MMDPALIKRDNTGKIIGGNSRNIKDLNSRDVYLFNNYANQEFDPMTLKLALSTQVSLAMAAAMLIILQI